MLLNCGAEEDSLRVPWTERRSNQSILKKINPKYSLVGLMPKLKFPILWPRNAKRSCIIGKDPGARKDWRQEEEGTTEDEMVGSPTWWTWVWANSGSWWWTGRPGMLQSMALQRVGHDWATELNWTEQLKNSMIPNFEDCYKNLKKQYMYFK